MGGTAIAPGDMVGDNRSTQVNQQVGTAGQDADAGIGMLGQHGAGLVDCSGYKDIETRQDHLPNSRYNCLSLNNNPQTRNIEAAPRLGKGKVPAGFLKSREKTGIFCPRPLTAFRPGIIF